MIVAQDITLYALLAEWQGKLRGVHDLELFFFTNHSLFVIILVDDQLFFNWPLAHLHTNSHS